MTKTGLIPTRNTTSSAKTVSTGIRARVAAGGDSAEQATSSLRKTMSAEVVFPKGEHKHRLGNAVVRVIVPSNLKLSDIDLGVVINAAKRDRAPGVCKQKTGRTAPCRL